ncbi:MAG: trehalase family glycosidase [Planctomycetota bacterium]
MIFADKGAWHGYGLDEAYALEAMSFVDGRRFSLDFTREVGGGALHADRIELEVAGRGPASLRFLDSRTALIQVPEGTAVQARGESPFRLIPDGPGRYLHVFPGGPRETAELEGLPRTLRWNWRSPLGGVRSAGAIPSPFAYNGLWAWDSWKHAAVLPTDLARSQIQAMFDHQRADGMVPDTVCRDASENNWDNSKPPLAAWACSRHEGLLEEFREPLLRYHRWWEAARRPAGQKLYAYGGAGLQQAKWESGWDNATRYDDAELVGGVQSVLSVDLNAWICLEKRLLGIPDPELEHLVDEVFYFEDSSGGAYFDVTWPDLKRVDTLTAATWIPLWCGVASPPRAEAVLRRMLSEEDFWTPLPFPSVARSDARFDPDGFWRGPVWMDYAAWGVEVLRRYGRRSEADAAAEKLLAAPADWECYNPLTGEPAQGVRPAVPQFSWTAAARIELERGLAGE